MSDDTQQKKQEIYDYLSQHPDFFCEFDDLLASMTINHQSGGAVSLLERQVHQLREKNTALNKKLSELLSNARENDRIYNLTRRAINALVESQEPSELTEVLHYHLSEEYKIPYFSLSLIRSDMVGDALDRGQINLLDGDAVETHFESQINATKPFVGKLNPTQNSLLFGEHSEKINSVAVAALKPGGELFGFLALGHDSELYYRSCSDTLFLAHLSEVLERLLKNFFR